MKKAECGMCGGMAVAVREEREVRVGRRRGVVTDRFLRCGECGEEFYEPGQMDVSLRAASRAIRQELGLLMPDEIRDLRHRLDLSQADFERLLGVGEKTVVRWEKGTVFQSRATDQLLRALGEVEGVAEFLARRSGVVLPGGAHSVTRARFS